MLDIGKLVQQIRLNCNISDAKYWGHYSICGLLMRYRELFRGEHSLAPWEKIPTAEISSWIDKREAAWKDLENEDLRQLIINDVAYDPFDSEAITHQLKSSGLIYGSGYGMFGKPAFFLARLVSSKEIYDYNIYYVGSELCRDLSAHPAMLQGRCIYLRLDSLRNVVWERLQELNPTHYTPVLDEIASHYDIPKGSGFMDGLVPKMDDVLRDVSELFLMHEVGEAFEDDFSDEWLEILNVGCDRHGELYVRATKDLLADTSVMGPLRMIVKQKNRVLLAFYMAFLHGIRKELFPEIKTAFEQFLMSGDWDLIERARNAGYAKANRLKEAIISLWKEQQGAENFKAALKSYITARTS